jgi:hypothetical protein
LFFLINCPSGGVWTTEDGDETALLRAEHRAWQHQECFDLVMKHCVQTPSSGEKLQQISAELASLFQRQIKLTRREALVGLTPAEYEEYDRVVDGIRDSYSELAKLRSKT